MLNIHAEFHKDYCAIYSKSHYNCLLRCHCHFGLVSERMELS